MEVDAGFPCPKCGAETQVFYSSKTGARIFWTCQGCKARGYFMGPRNEKAILLEA